MLNDSHVCTRHRRGGNAWVETPLLAHARARGSRGGSSPLAIVTPARRPAAFALAFTLALACSSATQAHELRRPVLALPRPFRKYAILSRRRSSVGRIRLRAPSDALTHPRAHLPPRLSHACLCATRPAYAHPRHQRTLRRRAACNHAARRRPGRGER